MCTQDPQTGQYYGSNCGSQGQGTTTDRDTGLSSPCRCEDTNGFNQKPHDPNDYDRVDWGNIFTATAGIVVAAVIFSGCATGTALVGAFACGVVAGAAGSATTSLLNGNDAATVAEDAAKGGLWGGLFGGLGYGASKTAQALRPAAPKLPKDVAVNEVAAKTATTSAWDILMPGGNAIGKAGTDATIREISGGYSDAQAMFNQLSRGGRVVANTSKLTRVELPNGGVVQLRTVMSRSPNTATIDVNIPGLDITKLKYNP